MNANFFVEDPETQQVQKFSFFVPDKKSVNLEEKYNANFVSRFYQICAFVDEFTNKHHVRSFLFNVNNECVNIKSFQIAKRDYSRIAQLLEPHQYKIYYCDNLEKVDCPNFFEILKYQSNFICDKFKTNKGVLY
jgi:hypothetical protein